MQTAGDATPSPTPSINSEAMAAAAGAATEGGVAPASPKAPPGNAEIRGWLYKWTNYIKGYQKRWFVLSNGLLSYYRSQSEMSSTCRGTISLHGAILHTEDACNFIISNGGGTQTFHLRASSEVERQKWVTSLELAKALALKSMDGKLSSEDEDLDEATMIDGEANAEITKQELTNVVKTLSAKLEDLHTCGNLIGKHGSALQTSLTELNLDKLTLPADERALLKDRIKTVNERAALLKLTSNAMVKASSDFVLQCQTDGRKWQRLLINEREIRQRLEDMVEQLAKQHSHLEAMVKKEHEHQQNNATVASGTGNGAAASAPKMQAAGGVAGAGAAANQTQAAASASMTSAADVRSATSNSGSDDDDEFEDAMDDVLQQFEVTAPPCYTDQNSASKSESGSKDDDRSDDDEETESDQNDGSKIMVFTKQHTETEKVPSSDGMSAKVQDSVDGAGGSGGEGKVVKRQRRTRIPDKPNISISLWGIVKNSIGKDLTKIPVPVNFSEPLSMLQRVTEDFEYSDILDRAAACEDKCEQMAYVAAFTVSSYSTTAVRSGKPFNPLLGETYEMDRSDDLGFRCVTEQVSHHPPMLAQYCESTRGQWRCWQEFSMRSKFKGKYLEVEPLGITHLEFPSSGNHYTWRKVKTVVHNIVIGKLWVDQHGEMSVINHKTGDKCHMKFEPYSYFGGTPKKVTGTIINNKEKVEWVLNGTWDKKLEGSKVIKEALVRGKSSLEIGPSIILWKVKPINPEAEKYYCLTEFACALNEMEEGVAPTDSRLRPDQRLMEETAWDEANTEKLRLEDKQRQVRKRREEEAAQAAKEGRHYEGYQPTWFKRVPDEQNGGKYIFSYKGGYWDAKAKGEWSQCPDIY